MSPHMKNTFIVISLLLNLSAGAQYYYNDIIGTEETNRVMKPIWTIRLKQLVQVVRIIAA